MSKLLLVEDDNNLREIYEARLQAEGYAIVTAKDGEEALAVAKTEKPDLIISDVMMPKISGFEMLDILKNTDGLKNVKVIMLTALGQSDDQQRANKLGADRYLVKSQVTLEDIVRVAHELLEDDEEAAVTDSVTAVPSETSAPSVTSSPPASAGIATPEPVAVPTPVPEVAKPSIAPAPSVPETTTSPVVSEPKEEVTAPPVATEPEPTPTASTPSDNAAVDEKLMNDAVSSLMNVSDPATAPVPSASPAPQTPADEPSASNTSAPELEENTYKDAATTSEEAASVDNQIEDFVQGATSEAPTPLEQQEQSDPSSPPASAGIATPEPVAVPTPVPEVAKPSIAPAPSVPETTTSPVVSEPKEEVTAPPVATEPEPTPTASTPSDNAAVDEKLMNDAVSSLMNVSDPATAPVPSASPAPQTPADEPSASNTSAPVPTQENSVKLDVSQANEPTTASPTMSHGKVITPTADIATIDKKPDIQALYAAEQAKEAAVNQPNPAPVVVETQTAQPSTENRPVDPSSIAL